MRLRSYLRPKTHKKDKRKDENSIFSKIELNIKNKMKRQKKKPVKGYEFFERNSVSFEMLNSYLMKVEDINTNLEILSNRKCRDKSKKGIYLIRFKHYDKIGRTTDWIKRKYQYHREGEQFNGVKVYFWNIEFKQCWIG
jgi:hypothetical protein